MASDFEIEELFYYVLGKTEKEVEDLLGRINKEKNMNLIEGLQKEITRCRGLLTIYEEIPASVYGVALIKGGIIYAEKAIADGDISAMRRSYKRLKEFE